MTEIEARGKIKYRIANEMRKAGENKEEYEDLEIALQVMKEIREYRELGTVEELQALKEKNEPKKPIYSDFDDNGNDEIIPYKAVCPVCGCEFEFGTWNDEENHHCRCGQKIDWEGGEE